MPASKPARVLFIEDNKVAAMETMAYLEEMPEAAGSITLVTTLAEGLSALGTPIHFDLILLDLVLPNGRGLGVLRAVLKAAPDVPVVVLTCLDDATTGAKALQLGAVDYLIKGRFEWPALARAVRYALERHDLSKEIEAAHVAVGQARAAVAADAAGSLAVGPATVAAVQPLISTVSERAAAFNTKLLEVLKQPADTAAPRMALRVLLVEDDGATREAMAAIMRQAGLAVTTAATGKVALDCLSSNTRPDIILLDLMMPEMDGQQFVAELRKCPCWRTLPVVVATAADAMVARGLDVQGILQKPYDPDTLMDKLQAVFAGGAGVQACH